MRILFLGLLVTVVVAVLAIPLPLSLKAFMLRLVVIPVSLGGRGLRLPVPFHLGLIPRVKLVEDVWVLVGLKNPRPIIYQ